MNFNRNDSTDYYFQHLLDGIWTQAGVIVLMAAFLFAFLLVIKPSFWRWVGIVAFLYLITFGEVAGGLGKVTDFTLIAPLQEIKRASRSVSLGLLALLLVPAVMSAADRKVSRIGPAILLLIVELTFSARLFIAGIVDRALFGSVIYILLFAIFAFSVSGWLRRLTDAYIVLRCIVGASALLIAGICVQLALNPSAIIFQNRLYGTTNNPNTMGFIIACTAPAACCLLVRKQEAWFWRFISGALLGISAIFIVWSGTRGGALAIVVGVAWFFRRRLRGLVLFFAVSGISAMAAYVVFADFLGGAGRILSTEDTRSAVWLSMISRFGANPWLGELLDEHGVKENLYLSVAASGGLFLLVPFIVFMIFTFRSFQRVRKLRPYLGDDSILADYVTASIVALAVSSMFDAHLLGTFVFSITCLYLDFAVMSAIQKFAPSEDLHDPMREDVPEGSDLNDISDGVHSPQHAL